MRISDWSSDVCSSDLLVDPFRGDLRRRHLDRANALQQRLEVLAQFELGPGLAIRGGDRGLAAAAFHPLERLPGPEREAGVIHLYRPVHRLVAGGYREVRDLAQPGVGALAGK